jgi:polyisoprenoid-binding protein YceI
MDTRSDLATAKIPLGAGTWTLDAGRSSVAFEVRMLGLLVVHGRFARLDATLEVGGSLAGTRTEATIDVSSIDTGKRRRDVDLRKAGYLAADEHPRATFRSTAVRDTGDGRYALDGELTLRGTTRPVTLDVTPDGLDAGPTGGPAEAGFSATTTVDRHDFGVGFHAPLGLDRAAVGRWITVVLDLRFVAPER